MPEGLSVGHREKRVEVGSDSVTVTSNTTWEGMVVTSSSERRQVNTSTRLNEQVVLILNSTISQRASRRSRDTQMISTRHGCPSSSARAITDMHWEARDKLYRRSTDMICRRSRGEMSGKLRARLVPPSSSTSNANADVCASPSRCLVRDGVHTPTPIQRVKTHPGWLKSPPACCSPST